MSIVMDALYKLRIITKSETLQLPSQVKHTLHNDLSDPEEKNFSRSLQQPKWNLGIKVSWCNGQILLGYQELTPRQFLF